MARPKKIKRIGVVAKKDGREFSDFLRRVLAWCAGEGLEVVLPERTAETVGEGRGVPLERIADDVDAVVVLGGDGTLLATARIVGERDAPILGVNLGTLGFLTEVTLETLFDVLTDMRDGSYVVSPRMALETTVLRDGETLCVHRALNDAVINKGSLARLFSMRTLVDDQELTTFRGDGLIFATPTGSTAYALSAGGPIVHPGLNCLLVVPICPFALTYRPIVLPESVVVKTEIRSGEYDVDLTVDGQVGVHLHEGDAVVVRRAKSDVKLIFSPHRTFYQVIQEKLKWGVQASAAHPGGARKD